MGILTRFFQTMARTKQTAHIVSPPEERPQGSSSPPRLLGSLPQPPEESRSPIVTDQELSPSERSGGIRSPPSFSSANFRSSVSCARLLRTSRPTSGSRVPP